VRRNPPSSAGSAEARASAPHRSVVAGLLAIGLLGVAVPSAVAASATRAATATSSHTPNPPPGYQLVSAAFSAPSGTQTPGSVTCPTGTVVLGGGVAIAGDQLTADVGGSYPDSETQWEGLVNNVASASVTFTVSAECADQSGDYSLVNTSPASVHAHGTGSVEATCPAGAYAVGGGGYSSGVSVNLDGIIPLGPVSDLYAWALNANNVGNAAGTIVGVVVCGQVTRYHLATVHETGILPDAQSSQIVKCPGSSVALDGGAATFKRNVHTGLAVSAPGAGAAPQEWQAVENNNSGSDELTEAYAICGT